MVQQPCSSPDQVLPPTTYWLQLLQISTERGVNGSLVLRKRCVLGQIPGNTFPDVSVLVALNWQFAPRSSSSCSTLVVGVMEQLPSLQGGSSPGLISSSHDKQNHCKGLNLSNSTAKFLTLLKQATSHKDKKSSDQTSFIRLVE